MNTVSSSSLQQLELCVALYALMLLLRAGSVPLVFAMPEHSIVGGARSKPGWFPYFVHIDDNFGGCGGALIAPDIVLTAAHCKFKYRFRHTTVYIGAFKRESLEGGAQIRYIKKWINHPKYVGNLLDFDYALAKLEEPVEIDQSRVRLELNDNSAFPKAGTALITMGLGESENRGYSNNLKNVTIPYVSNDRCSAMYSSDDDGDGYDGITPGMLCALDEEGAKDSCYGDSGGPIVERSYRGDGTFVDIHVGIVSWGDGCANPNKPGVYARTSAGVDWIRTTACEDLNSVATFCRKSEEAAPSAFPSDVSSRLLSHAPSRSKAPTMAPTKASKKKSSKKTSKKCKKAWKANGLG